MLGTFENPPVIIQLHRGKIVSLAFLYLALCISSYLMAAITLRDGEIGNFIWAVFLIIFFGTLLVFAVIALIRPSELIINRDGVEVRRFLTRRYAWKDIAGFEALWITLIKRRPFVILNESAKRHHLREDLGLGWEFGPLKVVEILREAQKRWGSRGV